MYFLFEKFLIVYNNVFITYIYHFPYILGMIIGCVVFTWLKALSEATSTQDCNPLQEIIH